MKTWYFEIYTTIVTLKMPKAFPPSFLHKHLMTQNSALKTDVKSPLCILPKTGKKKVTYHTEYL